MRQAPASPVRKIPGIREAAGHFPALCRCRQPWRCRLLQVSALSFHPSIVKIHLIAGNSAKKAPTKIETVKHALFLTEEEKQEIKKAIKKYKPESILILGTSDNMVIKIAENLGLPKIEKIIYIDEIATKEEMETCVVLLKRKDSKEEVEE